MKRTTLFLTGALFALATFSATSGTRPAAAHQSHGGYEVWVLDQSDTTPDGGGTLYIYQGDDLTKRKAGSATPEVIDLGGAARDLCLAQTGSAPKRPHMMMFNHDSHSHAAISFVASGHVLFMDGATRAPVACIDAGAQAHAAMPTHDGKYAIVANQNGKLLQRITTDYASNTFVMDNAATLDLANCTTPSGAACQDAALRPDNAPICPILDEDSRLSFVTLRGGGMFVVDHNATPMAIIAEYDQATVHPNGCGGVETNGKLYINAGGGAPANPLESDLYAFVLDDFAAASTTPNSPAPKLVFSHDDQGFVDSHGAVLTNNKERFVWVADRAANRIVVVNTRRDAVVNEINLVGALSSDPAPDLLDISPDGKWVFVTLRGPTPLTANVPDVNNAVGSTPGLGVVRVLGNGRNGELRVIMPITHVVNGVEAADPHGLALRRK